MPPHHPPHHPPHEPSHTPRTFSGACHGTLGELYQGPVTRDGERQIGLVSLPVDRHSWHHFTPAPPAGPGPERPLPHGEKAAKAVALFLERHARALPPGRWSHHTELDVGVGMASSTADIVSALRCLCQVLGLPHHQASQRAVMDVLSAVERADSVFLDEFALYLSARHRIVRRLGTSVRFHTAYVSEPGTVDTEAVTGLLLAHYRRRSTEYERCLDSMLKGFTAQDARAVARAATCSAALAQEVLPKAVFEAVLENRHEFAADGVFVAHTGSLVGYLFADRPGPQLKGELSAFFRTLGHQCSFAQGGCW